MNYKTAAGHTRRAIYEGQRGPKILAAVEHLIEVGPPEHRTYWRTWLAALTSGRRIKLGTYSITAREGDFQTFPPHMRDLVADVESAFTEGDEHGNEN